MHQLLKRGFVVTAIDAVNIDSATDNELIAFATPVRIRRVGAIVTTAVANAAGIVTVEIKRRPLEGTDANQVVLGTFQLTTTVTRAAGSYIYKDCHIDDADGETAEDGSLRNEAPSSNITPAIAGDDPWVIPLGQVLELEVVEAADSGAVRMVIEYDELPVTGMYIDQANVFKDVTNVA